MLDNVPGWLEAVAGVCVFILCLWGLMGMGRRAQNIYVRPPGNLPFGSEPTYLEYEHARKYPYDIP